MSEESAAAEESPIVEDPPFEVVPPTVKQLVGFIRSNFEEARAATRTKGLVDWPAFDQMLMRIEGQVARHAERIERERD